MIYSGPKVSPESGCKACQQSACCCVISSEENEQFIPTRHNQGACDSPNGEKQDAQRLEIRTSNSGDGRFDDRPSAVSTGLGGICSSAGASAAAKDPGVRGAARRSFLQ